MSDPHTETKAPATQDPHAAPGHDSHGHGEHHGSLLQHTKPYLIIGALLFVFTVITVALSYIEFGSVSKNIIIGMIVATFKVCLVGAWFMHLKNETSTIWRPLLFTFFFCLGLIMLCLLAFSDPIHSTSHPIH